MKVIKRGEGWKEEIVCTGNGNGGGGCQSVLEIDENDIYITRNTDITGVTDTYYTVCCPLCGAETDLNSISIPNRITVLASANKKEKILTRYKQLNIN